MELNPYAKFVAGRDAREVMGSTVARLEGLLGGFSAERMEQPIGVGKWSPRQIVTHLADCEIVFCFRLRQALSPRAGEPHSVIQPFNQDAWAERYAAYDADSAMAMFRAARVWNMKLLGTVTEADSKRTVTHPERGTIGFETLVETIAGHDLNHLGQLERLAAS